VLKPVGVRLGKRRDPVTGGVMSEASFDRVISEHLALRERNQRLEPRMPLDRYRDQGDDGSTGRASPAAPPNDEPETETVVNTAQQWLDSESLWDSSLERPLPEFDWSDA
jgi:hypothetical protein